MAKEFEMKVVGLKELEDLMMKHLPASTGRRVMLASLHKAAWPMLMTAKALVPKDSRALKISLGTKSWTMRDSKGSYAGISLGPMSGTGKDALAAWSVYMAHHGRQVNLERGKTVGRIRHGHLVEFGFKMRNGRRYPARRFLETSATVAAPAFVSAFKRDARDRILKAIRRHNARSPARMR